MDDLLITENQAWEIISEYVNDLLRLDNKGILAVYAIGSLGGGYYRPGKSDIDTIAIVNNDAIITQKKADQIAARYFNHYHIPKGFGSIIVTEKELFSPYYKSEQEEFEFSLEIVRLKLQGRPVYGSYDLSNVPMPTKDELLHDAQIMESWFDKDFGTEMFNQLEYVGCVNSILLYVRRYLMIEKNIFVLNKFNTIDAYINNDPPVVDNQIFTLINEILNGYEATENDLDGLRCFGNGIRSYMNKRLLNR